MVNVTYTTDLNNRLLTRRIHNMIGADMDNGARLIIWYNDYYERLDEPFALRPDVVIAPGAYNFGEWQFWLTSDPSKRLYSEIQYKPQTFFDGDRTDEPHPRTTADGPAVDGGEVLEERCEPAGG